jgi:type I restriction enzyme M protein
MVNLLFAEHKDELKGKGVVRSVYDPACGTGGMLTIAKDHIQKYINPDLEVIMFGQELSVLSAGLRRRKKMTGA